MKDFQARAPNALRRLDGGARALYATYLAFTTLGLLSAALLHADGLGVDGTTAAAWWRGDDVATYAKSYRQLAELTHFHLFTEPVVLLVVAHLYALGGDSPRRKVAAIVTTAASMTGQILLPWITTYGTALAGVLFLPVHALLLGGFAYMIGQAARDLWAARS